MLSNTLRLNCCYMKIIHTQIIHLRYHPKVIGHILQNTQKKKCVCIHEIIRLIIMKMKMKMKNRSRRYGINRPRGRHRHKCSKYKKCLIITMLICVKQHLTTFEAQLMKMSSNTEAELKKSVAYKKKRVIDKLFTI